ncbi:DEAD/DEAH box helicase family protein [uncultured Fluviicola sp.]|uniref:DEAD/DEAH box helicase n=1 Tax=uncultured Fluviicola sp. TaxID=463303 RepID=UPI0025D34347|nr:DEAD/DEAH box helicase family protein [uncultured Fluviicola sp.]
MSTITSPIHVILPPLEKQIFKNGKNSITNLISPKIKLAFTIVDSDSKSVTISAGKSNIYLTADSTNIPKNIKYALLTGSDPTTSNINDGSIEIKNWIKHPGLNMVQNPAKITSSWKSAFKFKEENVQSGDKGLRQPQIGALYMLLGHLKLPLNTATVVLPTGTGKTETMLSALVAQQCQKLLIIVPSDSLRTQLSGKFSTLGLLKEFDIVDDDALYPIVGTIGQGFSSVKDLSDFVSKCNVVITTMGILSRCDDDQKIEISKLFSNVFIDEAHHIKAKTWDKFKNIFPPEKVVQFTATPFRNDGKRLDGKIIFNFPLKKAQEQGYFTKIDFISLREYDFEKADKLIAETAINRLREDLKTYNHILMARCETKNRAIKVFEYYKDQLDLNPVLIYSGVPGFQETYKKILNKEAKIIVCVDMLGEGFDLPELKVAAFHDIRKSLPITLQFAGRFTRTKHDEALGNASFIANIADLNVRSELSELYARDADWNELLSEASLGRIGDEVDYKELIDGFSKLSDTKLPFQNIKPKFSTVVYKNKTKGWFPSNFPKGIPGYSNLEYVFSDVNDTEKILVIITARRNDVEWINHKDITILNWEMIVVFWETKNNLLFINSSDNGSLYGELAKAIIDESAELIKGINVFKTFHNVKRTRLQNVGLRYFLGKNVRFRMHVGSDVAQAISVVDEKKGEKAFVMGVGYENGNQVNLGASYKGRIWNKLVGDLMSFKKWCINLGNKLADPDIDPNQILKETLIPSLVTAVPQNMPVWIDWDEEMYMYSETRYQFEIDGAFFDLSKIEIQLENPQIGGPLMFSISSESKKATFEIELFENTTDPENIFPDYRIILRSRNNVEALYGNTKEPAIKFFENKTPMIWFADGSALCGNEYITLSQQINVYPREEIIAWDWSGTDLSKESQGVTPKITNSIQFKVIEELKKQDFDIIYDDDYSGEIADVVAMKLFSDRIEVKLFHLKFASKGKVTNQITNLYEVCGQAQKSIHWKHKSGDEFINHLLRREQKVKNGVSCSRIEKGSKQDLEKWLTIAKKEIPMAFEIIVVQPGFSKRTASTEILTLLGVTENFIKELANIDLKVISSY